MFHPTFDSQWFVFVSCRGWGHERPVAVLSAHWLTSVDNGRDNLEENLFVTAPQMTMMLHVWHRHMNHTTLMHAHPDYDITYARLFNQYGEEKEGGTR